MVHNSTDIYQLDLITEEILRKNEHVRSFAYYNLREDYGEAFARAWMETLALPPVLPIEEFLKKNSSLWKKAFEKTLHPHIWKKYIFASMQREAYLAGKGFLNTKKKLFEKWITTHHPDLIEAIELLWWRRGTFEKEILDAMGVKLREGKCSPDIEMEEEDYTRTFILSKEDREVEYEVEFHLSIWSATPEEIIKMKKDLWNSHILDVDEGVEYWGNLRVEDGLWSAEGPKITYPSHELNIWDGYGL